MNRDLPRLDELPDRWVDPEDQPLSTAEVLEGNELGSTIDVDNDDDAGDPTLTEPPR